MNSDIDEQLKKLKRLRDEGLIEEQVYRERQMQLVHQYTDVVPTHNDGGYSKADDKVETKADAKSKASSMFRKKSTSLDSTDSADYEPKKKKFHFGKHMDMDDPVIAMEMKRKATDTVDEVDPNEGKRCKDFFSNLSVDDLFDDVGVPDWKCWEWTVWVLIVIVVLTGYVVLIYFLWFIWSQVHTLPWPGFSSDGETFAWVSVGQRAYGFIAIGQFAVGFITLGQMTFGFINISQIGVGALFSVGMCTAGLGGTVGMVAFGGYNIASMLGISLFRTHFSIIGVHALFPFFAKDKKFYSSECLQACEDCK